MDRFVRISADAGQHQQWLHDTIALGFDRIYVHNVGPNQQEFIQVFGEQVLPGLARAHAELNVLES